MTTPGLTDKDLIALADLFPARDHEFLKGLIYIKEYSVCNRLDAVDPNWSFRPIRTNVIAPNIPDAQTEGIQITVYAELTINGVTRGSTGSATVEYAKTVDKSGKERINFYNEAEKSATTDALKRCARLFGVGRYLLLAGQKVTEGNLVSWLEYLRNNGYAMPEEDIDPDISSYAGQPAQDAAPTIEEAEKVLGTSVDLIGWEVSTGQDNKPYLVFTTKQDIEIWEPSTKPFVDLGLLTGKEITAKRAGKFEKPIKAAIDHIDKEWRIVIDSLK